VTDERFFKVWQAAKRLQCCQETIRRHIKPGRLRAVRMPSPIAGGHYRIPESALDEFLTHKNTTKADSAS